MPGGAAFLYFSAGCSAAPCVVNFKGGGRGRDSLAVDEVS